ncbi:MAG: hypothetical protein JSS76_02955 [Bacteroidetes bacterium]|nr:hypothetical protein [Bacteroidota bacterium]
MKDFQLKRIAKGTSLEGLIEILNERFGEIEKEMNRNRNELLKKLDEKVSQKHFDTVTSSLRKDISNLDTRLDKIDEKLEKLDLILSIVKKVANQKKKKKILIDSKKKKD